MTTDSWWTPTPGQNSELNGHPDKLVAHYMMGNSLCQRECVHELTVVIGSKVHGAGVVVGGASTGGRRNGQHVGEILPELGEQEDVVGGRVPDGFIDSWRPLIGTFRVKTRLLQA